MMVRLKHHAVSARTSLCPTACLVAGIGLASPAAAQASVRAGPGAGARGAVAGELPGLSAPSEDRDLRHRPADGPAHVEPRGQLSDREND